MSLCYTSNFISLNHQKSFSLTFSSESSPHFINLFPVKPQKPHHPIKFTAERFKLFASLTPSPPVETTPSSYRCKSPKDVNVLVVGSTGYIGKFVVRELGLWVLRDFQWTCAIWWMNMKLQLMNWSVFMAFSLPQSYSKLLFFIYVYFNGWISILNFLWIT